jgi:cyclophilin family peptidyl-prolyl cis-trans isomerase
MHPVHQCPVMRFIRCLLALAAVLTVLRAEDKLPEGLYAEFTTPHGVFTVELHHRQAPMTVANFVGLAEGTIAARDGKPFYTGLKFYRVVPGFVIQSGDAVRSAALPRTELTEAEDAAGHPHDFPDEFAPGLHHSAAGILSMANAGPDTNSTEFFVTLADCTRLNYLHSVFGRTVRGPGVLAKIQPDDPFAIRILRLGAEARAFKADETTFKALAAAAKKYSGTVEPGPAAHFDDPDAILPVVPPRARGFNFKLANFERATGIRIVARLSAQPPPSTEDEIAGAYMKTLAAKLGVARNGVLAAFFAPDDWRVWIGDDLVPAFLGRPVAPGDLGEGGALHDAKEALITAALNSGDAAFAEQQKSAPADRPPPAGQRIKLQTDALLDALLLRFEPRR